MYSILRDVSIAIGLEGGGFVHIEELNLQYPYIFTIIIELIRTTFEVVLTTKTIVIPELIGQDVYREIHSSDVTVQRER